MLRKLKEVDMHFYKNTYERRAAPPILWYYWNCVAGSTGLEPAASGVTGRRSNQTELRPPESRQMVGDTRIELVTYGL